MKKAISAGVIRSCNYVIYNRFKIASTLHIIAALLEMIPTHGQPLLRQQPNGRRKRATT